ncbi:hypothetical protein [Mucilaginibacter sp. NFX135]|uniref:hypothetical protein n=1 Tax=Mucilaginibacter sp. NFX135 TaxID=3402687 RepID=UPI003AFAEF57
MKVLTLAPHKPIIYLPGMISLVLLPMFCLIFLFQHKAFMHQFAMDVTMYDTSLDAKLKIPGVYYPQFPPVRNYLDINLDGNDAANKTRLDFARLEIREILDSKDTHKGIRFHFGKTSKYWSYVQAHDICQIEGVPAYTQYQDDIYASYTIPQKESKLYTMPCGGVRVFEVKTDQKIWEEQLQIIKSFCAPALLFVMMTFFTVKRSRFNFKRI